MVKMDSMVVKVWETMEHRYRKCGEQVPMHPVPGYTHALERFIGWLLLLRVFWAVSRNSWRSFM